MRAVSGERGHHAGFTLIELTIVLAVIVTLALVLTPSIANFVNDSKTARARNDCATIANAIVRFYKDTGFFPQWAHAVNGGPGDTSSRLTLLVGPGRVPAADNGNAGIQGWLVMNVGNGGAGALGNQLMTNAPLYLSRAPSAEFGWNGPYLSPAIGTDPWNNRYMVNVAAFDGFQEGQAQGGGFKKAVWAISAGPNGIIETTFSQPITSAVLGGDDIGKRIQ